MIMSLSINYCIKQSITDSVTNNIQSGSDAEKQNNVESLSKVTWSARKRRGNLVETIPPQLEKIRPKKCRVTSVGAK